MGAQLRYQYRVYPTLGQQDVLARSFGCAGGVQRLPAHPPGCVCGRGEPVRYRRTEAGGHRGEEDPGAGLVG
ncbi:helix-turn-helix domain-containing protein [Rhodococcus koreensis]